MSQIEEPIPDLVCMKCGSKMEYDPRYRSLECPHCKDWRVFRSHYPLGKDCPFCHSPFIYGKWDNVRLIACSNPSCPGWEWSTVHDMEGMVQVCYYDKKHVFSYDPYNKLSYINTLAYSVLKMEDHGSRYRYLAHAPYIDSLIPQIIAKRPETDWKELKEIPYFITTAGYGSPEQNYVSPGARCGLLNKIGDI